MRAGWFVYAALDLVHRPGFSTAVGVHAAAVGRISVIARRREEVQVLRGGLYLRLPS